MWHTRNGGYVLTLVCKITYWLKPGESIVAAEQEAVNEVDDHWDDDPKRSVRAPNDLMPKKIRPEVTLVGSAYAPNNQPVRSLVARLIVGDVDKAIEVFGDRVFLPDGSLYEGPRFTRMLLTWERAAGGPGTNNPVGIRADVRDAYGRRQLPNLQAVGSYITKAEDFIAPVGFGPIAATWPSRADLINRAPIAAGEGLEGMTAAYYNAAPSDQQLAALRENERIVLENLHSEHARLVTSLPGVRPVVFVERSSGMGQQAVVSADSLWIDTDRGIATMTWRTLIPLAQKDESGKILVTVEPAGHNITWDEMVRIMNRGGTNQADDDDDYDDIAMETITSPHSLIQAAAVLPFATPAQRSIAKPAREPMPSVPHAALPFQQMPAPSKPPASAPPLPWPSTPTPPPLGPIKAPPIPNSSPHPSARAPLPGTVVGPTAAAPPPPVSVAAIPPPPPPVRPPNTSLSEQNVASPDKPRSTSPWAGGTAGVAPGKPQTIGTQAVAAANAAVNAVVFADPPTEISGGIRSSAGFEPTFGNTKAAPSAPAPVPPAKVSSPGFDPALGVAKAPPSPPASAPQSRSPATGFDAAFGGKGAAQPRAAAHFDGAFGSVKAASDAAAARSEETENPRQRSSRREIGLDTPVTRRQAVVNLLHFDAQVLPRLRRLKKFASIIGSKNRARRNQGIDEPAKDAPSDDRVDVLRVLSCAQPSEAADIHRALTDCLDDIDDFDPPLLLVAGELRPVFDEVDVLRTTISVTQQVAGADKKVLAAIAVGQEAVSAAIPPRPETTMGLVRQIEQAAGSLNLPTRYVPAEVERILVEGRKYKKRTLFGASRLRADLSFARSGEAMPIYLPDAASNSLPLLLSFPVVALCEVTPREDLTESQDEALVVLALGRVLRNR